jgi:hypothetical protein
VDRWSLLKDVLLTGTGVAVILSQVFSSRPSDVLLVTGLALTVPSVTGHAAALLSGRTAGPSASHGEALPPSSSPSSQEAHGD